MNNKKLLFLHNLLSAPNFSFLIDKNLRVAFWKTYDHIQSAIREYNYKRLSIYLLNNGIEVDKDGAKSVDYPAYPIRKETTGEDSEYKEKLQKVIDQRKEIDLQSAALLNEKPDIKIERFMNDIQFDELAGKLNILEFETLREVLVVSDKKTDHKG